MIRKVAAMPQYMGPGSRGPLVFSLNLFLQGRLSKQENVRGIAPDQYYNEVLVVSYQRLHGLAATGANDQATFQKLAEEGFNLAAVAPYMPRPTTFVQPNGDQFEWSPAADWMSDPIAGHGGSPHSVQQYVYLM